MHIMQRRTPSRYEQKLHTYAQIVHMRETLPADFFSNRSDTDFLIDSIRVLQSDENPFFAYLAFTAPHDPLHAPKPWLSKFRGQ